MVALGQLALIDFRLFLDVELELDHQWGELRVGGYDYLLKHLQKFF